MEERILEALKATRARLESLDPQDRDEIAQIGMAIEELHSEIPAELGELRNVIGTSLEALQMLYEGAAPDGTSLAAALAAVACAAREILTSKAGHEPLAAAAGRVLWSAMGKDAGECPYRSQSSENVSLDDVAALVVQSDQDDKDGLAQLENALCEVSGGELPTAAQVLAFRAATSLHRVLNGTHEDTGAVIEEVGSLVQQAMDVVEEIETAEETEAGAPGNIDETDASCEVIRVAPPADEASADQNNTEDELETGSPCGEELEYLPSDTDHTLVSEFITECREYIESAEAALLALETNPKDASSLDTVFRAFHTIKGTSAFLGLNRMSDLAHRAESLLSRMRDGEIQCAGVYADLALRSTDVLTELLNGVQDALNGEPMVCPDKLGTLVRALENPEGSGGVPAPEAQARTEPRSSDEDRPSGEGRAPNVLRVVEGEPNAKPGTTETSGGAADSSVRVRTDRLDKIIDMVGELVIAHSMVGQDEIMALGHAQELTKKVIHLGKIVRELQYLAMSMRMVPLKATFQKMARLARDVARKSGKTVHFVTEGEDTEIDRNMVDVINVPLVHMVRNAVDHGIEAPEDRVTKGKHKSGTVTLSAYHSGGNVVVEMRDDGKGLDRAKIVEKAISKGLIESDKGLSDGDVYNLIFEPGFSTADKITDVSGRGVGLDAVKKGVEALRGRVEITSEAGKGCTFSLQLPLTMAVTDGMLVRVGNERFIIPTINIRVSFRPEAADLYTVVGKGEMVTLRGEPIPIVRLHRLFCIDDAVDDPTRALLVVLEDGDHPCALLVDELLGQQHVVAKSLGEGTGQISGISGGAILGDGRVGLILDPGKIAALARQSSTEVDLRNTHIQLVA